MNEKSKTLKGEIKPNGVTITRPWKGAWMPTLGMELEYKGQKYILTGYDKGRDDDTGPILWWLYLCPIKSHGERDGVAQTVLTRCAVD